MHSAEPSGAIDTAIDFDLLLDDVIAEWRDDTEEQPDSHQFLVDAPASLPRPPPLRSTASSAPKRARKPPKFANTRARQQHELTSLLTRAAEYEEVLQTLKRAKQEASFTPLGADRHSTWKTLADDQRERLARARYVNNHLRLRLQDEKKLAKRLRVFWRLLQERVVQCAVGGMLRL